MVSKLGWLWAGWLWLFAMFCWDWIGIFPHFAATGLAFFHILLGWLWATLAGLAFTALVFAGLALAQVGLSFGFYQALALAGWFWLCAKLAFCQVTFLLG